jgi:hypothetical protein
VNAGTAVNILFAHGGDRQPEIRPVLEVRAESRREKSMPATAVEQRFAQVARPWYRLKNNEDLTT